MFRITVAATALLLAVAIGNRPSAPPGAQDLLTRARALHQRFPVIDGHNDYPWEVREKARLDLDRLDLTLPQPSIMTDLGRLRAGGIGGQFWSVYVTAELAGQSAVTAALEQIDIVHRMMRKYPDALELALTADDVERIRKRGKIASLIGMEGGHAIDNSLGALRMFHRLGARYMTLTHSKNLAWADSATDKPDLGGLSPFGEEVVREMNRLGMLVDLSHVSPDTMSDAIRVSQAPVIFSHSSARAVTDVPRNVPDDILRLVTKNGGIVMVTFVPGFVSEQASAWDRARTAEATRLETESADDVSAVEAKLAAWIRANPAPRATIADVADHVDHIRKIAGIEHIGLGGDFDGISQVVQGLEDVSTYPALTAELLRRGYSDEDIGRINNSNILRVMREAERVAARLQGERAPSSLLFEGQPGR